MIRRLFPAFIALIVGATFFWFGWSRFSQSQASRSWPSVEGKVVSSKVAEHMRRKSGVLKRSYRPEIVYEYEVEGSRFRSDRIGFLDGSSNNRSYAEDRVEEFAAGMVVTVYYDPTDFEEACLDRSAGWMPWIMMGCGAVIVLVGVRLSTAGGIGRRLS